MFTVRPSEIHGSGCFANQKLVKGNKFVVPAYRVPMESDRTINMDSDGSIWDLYPPFCFLNHADKPNAEFFREDGRFWLRILKGINADAEVTLDYDNMGDI